MRYTQLLLLFLLLRLTTFAQEKTLYIDRIPIDSVDAPYAIVRMVKVSKGMYRLLFNHGQLTEIGTFRTRYKLDTNQNGILTLKTRPFVVSNRAEALGLLYKNGWQLLHYNQLASTAEAARAHQRFEFILEKVTP